MCFVNKSDMLLFLKKCFITFRSNFIVGKGRKRLRQRWRGIQKARLINNKIKQLRWGVSYSIYNGEELLEASIKSIRSVVNYIQVCYSTVSWYGEPADKNLVPLLENLKNKGLIDELVLFEPNIKDASRTSELKKRNFGLKYAKKAKVDYFMTMDCDEFFIARELEKAKFEIVRKGYTHAFCPIENYGYEPILKHYPDSSGFVQIFSKLHWFSKLSNSRHCVCDVDFTRKLSYYPFAKYWVFGTVRMHHFSYIRKNLKNKHTNASSCDFIRPKYVEKTENNLNNNFVKVNDIFNLVPIVNEFKKD